MNSFTFMFTKDIGETNSKQFEVRTEGDGGLLHATQTINALLIAIGSKSKSIVTHAGDRPLYG